MVTSKCVAEQTRAGALRNVRVRGSALAAHTNQGKIMTSIKRISALLLAASMMFAMGCASTSTQESTGEYMDDTAITAKVKTAIFNEPSLKVAQINVETYKSVVQLSGFVSSNADVNTAGAVARSVNGVVSVKNDIRIK